MPLAPRSAEILCIGTELLLGNIVNSNARWIAERLADLGIPHYYQQVVGDNPERIQAAIQVALARSNLLIFTGGLGPTPDDLTHETLASYFGVPLIAHASLMEDIRHKYAVRGRTPTANNFKQAQLPAGASILSNPSGTAPGLIWQPEPEVVLMTFPGVPAEMQRMWLEIAVPWLHRQGWGESTFASRMLRFWGISESALATKVESLFDRQNPTVAPYANYGEVKLRITAKAASPSAAAQLIEPVEAEIRAIAGLDCYGSDDDSLASVVGQCLLESRQSLAVAESCTGGGLGAAITAVPGSSTWFRGGVIAYDNAIKQSLLGVTAIALQSEGAVSAAVAQQMAQGARQQLGSDWALSITGIAGPTGGSKEKPVGLVYIGLAGPGGWSESIECRYGAERGREWVRRLSVNEALDRLRRRLAIR
jgi:nicotinamide-nucleotide amidase